jgi:GWxTD domain-containing protein
MLARAGLVTILLTALGLAAAAAAGATPLPRTVLLDHHLELQGGGEPTLQFDLSIPLEQLVFRRSGEGFAAEIRLALRAERSGDHHVESVLMNETVSRPDFISSRMPNDLFRKSFELGLAPGKWQVEVQIYRKSDANPWRQSFKLQVPEPGEGVFFLQGPNWRAGSLADRLSEPFTFRDPWALAGSEAHFADGLNGRANLECDVIFWSDPAGDVELLFSLMSADGKLASYAHRTLRPRVGRNAVVWDIAVGRISMGAYMAEVELVGEDGRMRIRGRLDVGLTGAAFDRDWGETLKLIKGLADPEEWDALSDAKGEQRLEAWRAFWERRDPNGPAPGNIFEEGFWNRFSVANARFSSTFQDGYKSDRGHIYLELGEPDRVETYQDDSNFRVLLYWHYSRLGRVYIFEDRHGYENFTLIRVSG